MKCARVDFQAPFLQAPYVVVTLNHRLAPSQPAHAAASAWVEGVHKAGFRVCLAGSDVPTDDIQLDWLAFDRASAASTFFCACGTEWRRCATRMRADATPRLVPHPARRQEARGARHGRVCGR